MNCLSKGTIERDALSPNEIFCWREVHTTTLLQGTAAYPNVKVMQEMRLLADSTFVQPLDHITMHTSSRARSTTCHVIHHIFRRALMLPTDNMS